MIRVWLIATLLGLAGCVQLPPNPQEAQSKKFEAVPDKAVIYIVRSASDSNEAGTLLLDHAAVLTTFRDTYYRWEVPPGRHRVAGFAGDSSFVNLDVQAGRIYFVEYTVRGSVRYGWQVTQLQRVDEARGSTLVRGASLL